MTKSGKLAFQGFVFMNKNISFYGKLVMVAYGYFILLGLLWFCASFYFGGGFSYFACMLLAAYGIQAYFQKKIVNLILGIISFAISIFWALEFASLGLGRGFGAFSGIMLGICLVSLIMSGILIFSYTKLSFGNE